MNDRRYVRDLAVERDPERISRRFERNVHLPPAGDFVPLIDIAEFPRHRLFNCLDYRRKIVRERDVEGRRRQRRKSVDVRGYGWRGSINIELCLATADNQQSGRECKCRRCSALKRLGENCRN